MVAYSFKRQFAEPILAGTKGGTIRADRKRHARPGEHLQLYTGMRTKQCRLICRHQCAAVTDIVLNFRNNLVFFSYGPDQGRYLTSGAHLNAFALFDGFVDFEELRAFWRQEHGEAIEFQGVHIRWLPLPEALL